MTDHERLTALQELPSALLNQVMALLLLDCSIAMRQLLDELKGSGSDSTINRLATANEIVHTAASFFLSSGNVDRFPPARIAALIDEARRQRLINISSFDRRAFPNS